jgi:hypothetical protein
VIACSEEEALRLIRGEHNLMTAAMRGDVRLSGRPDLWKGFHDATPAPLDGTTEPPARAA